MIPEGLRVHDDAGTLYIEQKYLLGSYAKRATDFLDYGEEDSPELLLARQIGQALLNLRLNEDRPVAMLADDVSLRMGAMYVGIPYVLIEASQLEHATELLTPGLVVTSEVPKAVATPAVDRAHAEVTPDSIAAFAWTADSNAVVWTHRRLTSAEEMARGGGTPTFGSIEAGPYILMDGLPPRGVQLKLMASGELRVKAPTVTPGYWRRPDLTRAAFDEEGYFRIRDARFRWDGRVIVKEE